MKTAKEMLEELGYEKFGETTKHIVYRNKEHNYYVTFELIHKSFLVHKPYTTFNLITLKELQAINKQVEELGWLEELDK